MYPWIKYVKYLTYRLLDYTAFTPLARFPRLPGNKYGQYICQACYKRQAEYWHEHSKLKYCFICAVEDKS